MNKAQIMKQKILMVIFGWMLLFTAVPAYAGAGDLNKGTLEGIVTLIFILSAVGVGLAAKGIMVNHIFYQRTNVAYIILKRKPGLSLLMGIIVTLVGFGLIAILKGTEQLQGLVLIIYLLGIGMFGIGIVVRLAAHIVEPIEIEEKIPGTRAFVKGGMLFAALNVIILLGNILFFSALLAGIGATLLGYFTGMGYAVSGAIEKPVKPTEAQ